MEIRNEDDDDDVDDDDVDDDNDYDDESPTVMRPLKNDR